MAADQMYRHEPCRERYLAPVHHRSGGHGGLPSAIGAFPCELLAGKLPSLQAAAGRADETTRPPPRRKVIGASAIIGKALRESGPGLRSVALIPSAGHENIIGTSGARGNEFSLPAPPF